jgi:hypothetical protein
MYTPNTVKDTWGAIPLIGILGALHVHAYVGAKHVCGGGGSFMIGF